MAKVILKALVVFWPFLRSVIFKDRPVKEVLKVNRQFTYLFGFLLVLTGVLYLTTTTLTQTQEALRMANRELILLRQELGRPSDDIVTVDPDLDCVPPAYDKNWVIELLEEGS